MIGAIVYFGLGFLAASLCGLVVIRLVHARAGHSTARAPEPPFPVSMAEIKADKNQLRAEITMSLRGLEGKVRQLRIGAKERLTELGTKNGTIDRLKAELREKAAALAALEARDRALVARLNATEEELSSSESALRDARRALADKELQLAWITTHFNEPSALADGLRFRRATSRLSKNAAASTAEGHIQTLETAPPTAPTGPSRHDRPG
jgi:chromosome segregation ATPase